MKELRLPFGYIHICNSTPQLDGNCYSYAYKVLEHILQGCCQDCLVSSSALRSGRARPERARAQSIKTSIRSFNAP